MVPEVGSKLPDRTLIVRPHPNERSEPWIAAAAGHDNIEVVHDGNVIPWLLAADVLLHNGLYHRNRSVCPRPAGRRLPAREGRPFRFRSAEFTES